MGILFSSETNLTSVATSLYVSPCVNCFHFKQKIVHDNNVAEEIFLHNVPLKKKLFTDGQAWIWFCTKGLLPRRIYVVEYEIKHITNPECKEREE